MAPYGFFFILKKKYEGLKSSSLKNLQKTQCILVIEVGPSWNWEFALQLYLWTQKKKLQLYLWHLGHSQFLVTFRITVST